MDHNIVVLVGRLAAEPDVRELQSGTRLIRYLVTMRLEYPRRRVDVVPVTLWDPPDSLVAQKPPAGQRVWVSGWVQRRFWEVEGARRSRIEVVASTVCLRDEPDGEPFASTSDRPNGHEVPPPGR